jgi:hypothetical protein
VEPRADGSTEVRAAHSNLLAAAEGFWARRAGCALLFLLLGACVVIPSPNAFVGSHKSVPDSVVRSIQPGTSTRADILLQLSEPWTRGKADGYFVYSWIESLGGGGAAVGAVPRIGLVGSVIEAGFKCHCLVIQFSDQGLVERTTVLSDADTAVDVTVFPCPSQGMRDAIQLWLARSPARP